MDMLTLVVAVAGGVALAAVAAWFVFHRRGRGTRDPIATELRKLEQSTSDDEQAATLRLGNIYTLADIAERAPEHQAQIIEQLAAYIRERRPCRQLTEEVEPGDEHARPPAEIQAILDLIGRRLSGQQLDQAERIDLRETDLRGANFHTLDFSGAVLRSADLSGASFDSANLSGTDLRGATLIGADLRDAHMNGAYLFRADLRWALLDDAYLSRVDLRAVNCADASFAGAHAGSADLRQANLTGCDLSRAMLERADLRGADFSGAVLAGTYLQGANLAETNITADQLADAITDETTVLPRTSAEI